MKFFSIGQVSAMLAMPVKTIRYYDEIGLCSPSETNPDSGYRHYSVDDVIKLDMIRCLGRVLGMPLRTIREYMENNSDPKLLKEYLLQQEREIDAEIERLLERRALLNDKLDLAIRKEMTSLLVPSVVQFPERTIYTRAHTADTIDQAMVDIRQIASASQEVDKHKLYVLKDDISIESLECFWHDYIGGTDFRPPDDPEIVPCVLPAGSYAVISFQNKKDLRRNAYHIFRDFINANGYSVTGPLIYEYALLDLTALTVSDLYYQLQIHIFGGQLK